MSFHSISGRGDRVPLSQQSSTLICALCGMSLSVLMSSMTVILVFPFVGGVDGDECDDA